MNEIRLGIMKGLDISYYTNPNFKWKQMHQIRLGLEQELDVSKYADLDFDWKQMYQIRCGLINNVNVSYYANPIYNHKQMEQLRLGLEDGINIVPYAYIVDYIPCTKENSDNMDEEEHEEFDSIRSNTIYKLSHDFVTAIKEFNNDTRYDKNMKDLIKRGILEGLNVSYYTNPKFSYGQMIEIYLGLKHNVDVSIYATDDFDARQMKTIRIALEDDYIDLSPYMNCGFDYDQICVIHCGLKEGLDISVYANPEFNANQMRVILKELSNAQE
jgi:hypothetical protein